jgi:hypothetical protein
MATRSWITRVEALEKQLERATIGGGNARTRRNRRRRQKRKEAGPVAAQPFVASVAQNPTVGRSAFSGRRRANRRRGPGIVNPEGSVRIARPEFFIEVKGGTTLSTTLETKHLGWLDGLARNFDRIVWHSCSLIYKPAVGTTKDGLISLGVDWNSSSPAKERKDVLKLTPILDLPVWQATSGRGLILPTSKLQSRKEYFVSGGDVQDNCPGAVVYNCSGTGSGVYGEIWVHYDVSLFGTR